MQVTELKKDQLDFHVRVVVPSSAIDAGISKELVELAAKAKLSGFRVGKVPLSIVRQKFGSSVRSDVVREQIRQKISEIVVRDGLKLAVDPVIEDIIDDGQKDLEFTVKFELLSNIQLPNFQDITIEKPVLELSDQDIEKSLERLAESNRSYDRQTIEKARSGDQVIINAIGYIDGVAFDGGKLDEHKLVLGSGVFIPGFEEQLVGSKAGDKVIVKVKFPEQYHATNLAGKDSEFLVEIIAVYTESAVEINDEFAKKLDCEDLAQLKEKIAQNMRAGAERQSRYLVVLNLFDQLEKILDFPVPKSLMKKEYQFLQKAVEDSSNDRTDQSQSEMDEYYQKIALRRVRIGLLLVEYAKLQDLRVTQDDIKRAVLAKIQESPNEANQILEYYTKNQQAIESLSGAIVEEKAISHMLDNGVNLIKKQCSTQEFEQLIESANAGVV